MVPPRGRKVRTWGRRSRYFTRNFSCLPAPSPTRSTLARDSLIRGIIFVWPVEAGKEIGAGDTLAQWRAQHLSRRKKDLAVAGDDLEVWQHLIEFAVPLQLHDH